MLKAARNLQAFNPDAQIYDKSTEKQMTENEKNPFSVICGKRLIYNFPFRHYVPRSGRAEKPALPNGETGTPAREGYEEETGKEKLGFCIQQRVLPHFCVRQHWFIC